MKGSMFKVFEQHLDATYGDGAFEVAVDDADLSDALPFVGPGTYPADHLLAIVGAAASRHHVPVDALVWSFGRAAFPALARSAGPLMDIAPDARSFLFALESVVHTEVRKLDETARPARFTVTALGEDLLLHYESELGLFPLVEGLLAGVGDWFDTSITSELVETEGTCARFKVSIGSRSPETVGA